MNVGRFVPGRSGNRSIGAALIGAALVAVIGGAMLLAGAGSAAAVDQPTEAQILDALKATRAVFSALHETIGVFISSPVPPKRVRPRFRERGDFYNH
jgi:hypothetical protein